MSDPAGDLPLVTIEPGGTYAPEFRKQCVAALGEDGAWLMTSMLHYGWRTQYDLARGLALVRPRGSYTRVI